MTDLALQDLTLRHHGQVIARLNLTVQRQPWPDLVVALPPGAPQ